MEQKTAVEWLEERLLINGTILPSDIEYAKEIEREQTINLAKEAYHKGASMASLAPKKINIPK